MKILFIDESAIFGGHEIMFLELLKGILSNSSHDVHMIINANNQRLSSELDQLSKMFILFSYEVKAFSKIKIRPITNIFCINDFLFFRGVLKSRSPDLCVVVQGTIEIGSIFLLASRLLKVKTLSYLPITKKSGELNVFLGRVRDWINKHLYYQLPHEIITISKFNQQELVDNFNVKKCKTSIVYNFRVNSPLDAHPTSRTSSSKHFALIGRVNNTQKCQYDFFEYFIRNGLPENINFHVVGDDDNNDSIELRELCENNKYIHFHGWCNQNEVNEILNEMDGIIIPSRYEGVPLVMIDAINNNKLVFASAVDGMLEFLPDEFLFQLDDYASASNILTDYIKNNEKYTSLLGNVKKDFEVFNMNRSQKGFLKILNSHLV